MSDPPILRPFDFTRCDECGDALEPESRLFGLCADCEREIRRPPKKPVPKARAGGDRSI